MSVLAGLVVLAIVELAALVAVAERIGVFAAVGLLIVVSACGPAIVRRAGFGALRRAQARLAQGGRLEREALDGLLILAAGVLICVPGFVTDALGLLLLLPPVRALARRRLSRSTSLSAVQRFGAGRRWMGGPWDGGEVIDAGSHPQRGRGSRRSPGVGGELPGPGSAPSDGRPR